MYQRFWTSVLERLQAEHAGWTTAKVPQSTNWVSMPCPIAGCTYDTSFAARARVRHGIYIDSGDGDTNSAVSTALTSRRAAIEATYGGALEWEELPERPACRVAEYGIEMSATRRNTRPTSIGSSTEALASGPQSLMLPQPSPANLARWTRPPDRRRPISSARLVVMGPGSQAGTATC